MVNTTLWTDPLFFVPVSIMVVVWLVLFMYGDRQAMKETMVVSEEQDQKDKAEQEYREWEKLHCGGIQYNEERK